LTHVLVAQEPRLYAFDVPDACLRRALPHDVEHRYRDIDRDDAAAMWGGGQGKCSGAGAEIDERVLLVQSQAEQVRQVVGRVGSRLAVVPGDVVGIEVLAAGEV